jgi:hypothetical protein
VSSALASCTDASFSAVFRYARRTFAAWPGDLFARAIASFLAFLARQRSWVFLRPSQVCSRKRVSRHLWRSGPTCRFARRASDPIDFRRADRSAPGGGVVGRGLFLSARRSTSGLRSRLRSVSRSNEPRDRSCLGLCLLQGCGRVSAHAIGLDPNRITSLRDPAGSLIVANRASLSAHGFSTLAPIANRRKSRPFSVLMGLMPCRPERLRGPSEGQLPV